MSDGLKRLPPRFLADNERFRGSGIEAPLSLRDYWRWSASSLMDNTARGLVAEFLVATALEGYIKCEYGFRSRLQGSGSVVGCTVLVDYDTWGESHLPGIRQRATEIVVQFR